MDGSSGFAHGSSSSSAERLPFVGTRGIAKSYGGVRALHGIDLDIYPGEVHGLVGANGAGKSTFIKLLAGLEIPDAGTIALDTRPVVLLNPEQSTRLGLSFIHQELHLVPQFNALQNLTLGLPKPKRAGLIHWPAVRSNVSGLIKRLGINFSLEVPVAADAYLLNAFAAVFLGSATLKDGEFHIPGTLVGVLIIGIGFNGLAIFGAPTFYQYLFQGAILIAAVALSTVARRYSKL